MPTVTSWAGVRTQERRGGKVSEEVTLVTMRERVKVLKVDLDNPEKEPEMVEQETVSKISLDDAALLGFVPGQGFRAIQKDLTEDMQIVRAFHSGEAVSTLEALPDGFDPLPPYQDTYTAAEANQAWNEFTRDADGPPPPVEGVRVGDR